MSRKHHKTLIAIATASCLGACVDEFDPYNEVQGFRVLAIAADHPELLPGETAQLSALLSVDDSEATFAWSWCPFPTGRSQAFECAVTRDELQEIVDGVAGPGQVDVPDFDLGADPTASFAYSLPPELFQGVCEALGMGELPAGVEVPACESSYQITVRLEVESGSERITGIKNVRLLYQEGDWPPNQNPTLGDLVAVDPDQPSTDIPLPEAGPGALAREVEYTLRVGLAASASEFYRRVPREGGPPEELREDLFITWFIEAGETDLMRTSFLDGEISLDDARENSWTTPSAQEHAADTTRLYLVVRDNRGGASWITREIGLEQ